MTPRNEVEDFLRKFGAFKVGVADPEQGFKAAKSGCHPRDVMKISKVTLGEVEALT